MAANLTFRSIPFLSSDKINGPVNAAKIEVNSCNGSQPIRHFPRVRGENQKQHKTWLISMVWLDSALCNLLLSIYFRGGSLQIDFPNRLAIPFLQFIPNSTHRKIQVFPNQKSSPNFSSNLNPYPPSLSW